MFHNNKPVFAGGVVLKAKMLDNISKYARDMFDILYDRYTDGILSGVRVCIEDRATIRVTKGIIKFKGELYHMDNDTCINVYPNRETQYLRVRFLEKEMKIDEEKLETFFVLDTEETKDDNEIEICRFILNEGAILRNDYTDLRDYATIHNTVNTLETKYSAIDKPTFNPGFLLEFGRTMRGYNLTNVEDVVFITECIKEENIKRELIESYISKRLGEQNRSYTNQEIYRKLIEISEVAKRGESGNGMQGRMPVRRMIVD